MAKQINFTQTSIASLTWQPDPSHPRKDRYWIYDTKRVGLAVMVTSKGTKSFYLVRKVSGKTERIPLGRFPAVTAEQARAAAERKNGEIASGKNPAAERRERRGAMTLGELLTHYIETHAKHHKKRWRDDIEQFERYFGRAEKASPATEPPDAKQKPTPFPGWRNKKVNAIASSEIQSLHVKLGEKHGRYAANRLLALLSSMFENGNLPNPTKDVKRFREEHRERFLDADELPRFFAAVEKEPDKTASDYFKMLLYTLARRSNVAAMDWANVNFGRREWTVAGEKMKNGDPLIVSLTDEAMEVLQRRWGEREHRAVYVFPGRGAKGYFVEPKGAWKRVMTAAGIQNFRIHDLRHTGASWMAIGGVSLPIIGKVLGHRSQQSTARYAHVNRSAAAAALQAATKALSAVASGKKAKRNVKQGKTG